MNDPQINLKIANIIGSDEVKDYANDLNSCRDFETWLKNREWKEARDLIASYMDNLYRVIGCLSSATFRIAYATPSEKREAFLRSMDGWKD